MKSIHSQKGFTLIELLIVVAIIAILAAIAIPNFLAAQTRAKVSRVKGEMRSLATGLESFAVDNGQYPYAYSIRPGITIGWTSPDLTPPYLLRLVSLTTPVAYISSLPYDIFNPGSDGWSANGQAGYVYYTSYSTDVLHVSMGGSGDFPVPSWVSENQEAKWRLASYSPFRIRFYGNTNFVTEGQMGLRALDYDPTNGTISNGFVTRIGP